MEKIFCAFSSDSRTLYKADIYRVLSLPKGNIVHFRYDIKYVMDCLCIDPKKLLGKKIAIFHTHGNDLISSIGELLNTPVRWATIAHLEKSDDTKIFHLYLKLGDFCNVTINSSSSSNSNNFPPNKFLSQLECEVSEEQNTWMDRVLSLKDSIKVKGNKKGLTFFHIKGIYYKNKEQKVEYENDSKSCHYNLVHGKKYVIKMSLGNPDIPNTKITLSDSSEEITFNIINPITISARFDDCDIPISIKALDVLKTASLLKFELNNPDEDTDLDEFTTNIELNLKRSLWQPFKFGFYTTAGIWGALLVKLASPSAIWPSPWVLLSLTILLWLSTGSLFYWFNKK